MKELSNVAKLINEILVNIVLDLLKILKLYGPIFMDGVQLSRGCRATTRRQFIPLSPKEFLVLV